MPKLDIFAPRSFHTIEIIMEKGETKTYKIPVELNVEETERLFEVQSKIENLTDQKVQDDGKTQLRNYWELVYSQLEIIMNHYQDLSYDYIREYIMPTDAIRILSFFAENRYVITQPDDKSDSKKKLHSIT